MTTIPNFNRMVGRDPNELNQLTTACGSKSGRAKVLDQNAAFYQAIIAAIYAKNKADYPPFGRMSDDEKTFHNTKLKYLIEAFMTLDLGGMHIVNATTGQQLTIKPNNTNSVGGGANMSRQPAYAQPVYGQPVYPQTQPVYPQPVYQQTQPVYAPQQPQQIQQSQIINGVINDAKRINNLRGKMPQDIQFLINFCDGNPENKFKLLQLANNFRWALDFACGSKNVTDYTAIKSNPDSKRIPLPNTNVTTRDTSTSSDVAITDPKIKAFQTEKLRCLFKAILDLEDLSGINMATLTKSGFNTLGTWTMNAARGIGRTITNPFATAKSTADSVRNLGRYGGGKRRDTKRKKYISRTYKRRPHRPKRRSIRRL